MKPCGNEECCCSTFIDDITITYGRGELDTNGLWEIPCYICARAAEKRDNKSKNTYWPFEPNIMKRIIDA
jgi:hypothetical protein